MPEDVLKHIRDFCQDEQQFIVQSLWEKASDEWLRKKVWSVIAGSLLLLAQVFPFCLFFSHSSIGVGLSASFNTLYVC